MGRNLECKIVIKSFHGVGKFKNKAVNVFKKKILKDNPDAEFTVLLCMDTDVFELSSKPPFDPKELKELLLGLGAEKVEFIKAKKCIEDWFLIDMPGVLKYLKLPKSTKVTGNTGTKKLENLFKKGNKIYIKGKKSEGFIKALDIEKIIKERSNELKPLIKALENK